jgi:hypothetical protein
MTSLPPFLQWLLALVLLLPGQAAAGELTVSLPGAKGVILVGAFARWDQDGNPRKPVDAKAKIDAPQVTAQARPKGSLWVFPNLPPGRYDLVILAKNRVRVEGFHYPPVAEFDPFLPGEAKAPEEAAEAILKDLRQSQHYENKVASLYLGGDDKQVRVFMQLVRDKETSYDADFGAPVATVRHEVWQYTYKRGVWSKERRTKILDRILLARSEFRQWTWVWEPSLGGIEVGKKPASVTFRWPDKFDPETTRGWLPQ